MRNEGFDAWLAELRELAVAADLPWLISGDPQPHRDAWARGISPEQEFSALARVAEWRGSGCSGG